MEISKVTRMLFEHASALYDMEQETERLSDYLRENPDSISESKRHSLERRRDRMEDEYVMQSKTLYNIAETLNLNSNNRLKSAFALDAISLNNYHNAINKFLERMPDWHILEASDDVQFLIKKGTRLPKNELFNHNYNSYFIISLNNKYSEYQYHTNLTQLGNYMTNSTYFDKNDPINIMNESLIECIDEDIKFKLTFKNDIGLVARTARRNSLDKIYSLKNTIEIEKKSIYFFDNLLDND